jgi:hypothetical protein
VAHGGRLRVGPADAPVVLTAGDAASHRVDREHVHEALGPGTTGLILTACPSPERGGTVGRGAWTSARNSRKGTGGMRAEGAARTDGPFSYSVEVVRRGAGQ